MNDDGPLVRWMGGLSFEKIYSNCPAVLERVRIDLEALR
jgi:hypothetical protein